jgi:hypothetical protein
MRVQAFRAWFSSALNQGWGAARRAGLAISRRIKQATGRIEISVGVGDDESRFGGSGSRAWLQLIEEARTRLLQLFEKSYFERFPRFERFMRRILGQPAALKKIAPPIKQSPKATQVAARAHQPSSAEAARLAAEVRRSMMAAHTREHAGLRETVARRRRGDEGEERGDEQQDEQNGQPMEEETDPNAEVNRNESR